jgi:nucleotidyltransferase substrate binding protein (TIGR01987 family)
VKGVEAMNQSSIDISKLLKAQAVFERFRRDMKDDRDQAGAVRAFEFCYELAWKMMKRFLIARGQETGSPKDTFRAAALEKLIDDPEVWFEFQKKRNLTVHTYEQENLDAIVVIFDLFSTELSMLIDRLKAII